jgi:hypothetical protein
MLIGTKQILGNFRSHQYTYKILGNFRTVYTEYERSVKLEAWENPDLGDRSKAAVPSPKDVQDDEPPNRQDVPRSQLSVIVTCTMVQRAITLWYKPNSNKPNSPFRKKSMPCAAHLPFKDLKESLWIGHGPYRWIASM